MAKSWLEFWNNYRGSQAHCEDDLFVQVGKTINKEPINRSIFSAMILRLRAQLQLGCGDHLLDLCCGNGLVSYELAKYVRRVTAVDFSEHLIRSALEMKWAPNIKYVCNDVSKPLDDLADSVPNKILMNDALAYFEPGTLRSMLSNFIDSLDGAPMVLLITGVPNYDLRWNFYNTPERKARFLESEANGGGDNDGLGRWWQTDEIESLCREFNLSCEIEDQPIEISSYRMDVLIKGPALR
jgi:SAM-dependent methyltransferase